MKRKLLNCTLENTLKLFSLRLKDFKGTSHRSYQKSFSSFQIFLLNFYPLTSSLERQVIENWLIHLALQGLSFKTISFYLDKVASLYSSSAHKMEGGKTTVFKDVKKSFKKMSPSSVAGKNLPELSVRLRKLHEKASQSKKPSLLLEFLKSYDGTPLPSGKTSLKLLWALTALHSGVRPDIVKGIVGEIPPALKILSLSSGRTIKDTDISQARDNIRKALQGEEPLWFAMRLRPKVKFEHLIDRITLLENDFPRPELFYPSQEIARRIGRKMVWKGKPVIRDVVFFKYRRSEIYPLFTRLYDIAWCYRNPGGKPGNYASIPPRAMEDFKEALGFLSPDFEIAPAGEFSLRPGDEVVIVNGDYAESHARILKKPSIDEDGNKVYRVTLLNSNGHWDIGIDARLLKKA